MSSALHCCLRLMLPLALALLLANTNAQQFYNKAPPRQPAYSSSIEVIAQWQQLEYGFARVADRQQANATGNLLPENGTPIDVDVQYGGDGGGQQPQRIFTTIPKFVGGIPYSLATVTTRRGAKGPMLQPYPNYDWHRSNGANCDQITSAFRVAITPCNQMWVIDSGMVAGAQLCAPQLLLFDLANDRLLYRYRFEADLYMPRASLFITPAVVVGDPPPRGNCARTMIYVADVTYHGLVVYDHQAKAAWRAEHRYMYPDPDFGSHSVAGENFTLMDGIFALSADKRNLYFHPMASQSEYAVPLQVLNNRQNWANGVEAMDQEFVELGKRKSECAASAMDSRGNLYCVTLNPIKLIVWSNSMSYGTRNFDILPANATELEFVSGMKVVRNVAGKEELWMFSNRFQKIAAGTINPNEVNFRILKRSLDDLQGGGRGGGDDLSNRLVFN